MRTVIILTMSAGIALAQQAARPCQVEETTLKRSEVLVQSGAMPLRELETARQALARCQTQEAQLANIKAAENSTQARLDELRKTYSDSHPDIVALRTHMAELLAQEAGLRQRISIRRSPDVPASLNRANGLQTGLPDRWWKNPATVQSLGLTADQQKKMDDIFQQYRLKLIDLNAALEREEVTLDPLVSAESLDDSRITAQIDRVAQARAELEKANGRMLLGIRKLLSTEQWNKLNQLSSPWQGQK